MHRSTLAATLVLFAVACVPSSHGRDDAAPDSADPEAGVVVSDGGFDAGLCEAPTDGCACDEPGRTECEPAAGRGAQCCDGVWQDFWDGPCSLPLDGSVPTCGSHPDVGCFCPTEGAIECRGTAHWRLVCAGGVWVEDDGWVCC